MPKRNRFILFLLMPFILLIWLIGWILYAVGYNKETAKPKKKDRSARHDPDSKQ